MLSINHKYDVNKIILEIFQHTKLKKPKKIMLNLIIYD